MAEKILQNVTCKDRPTMEQLMKIMRVGHIDIATKWHELGPVLVDSYSVVREIEANYRNDVSACCRIMFEKWLDMKPGASWDELVTALNNIEMKTAADFVSKQFKSDVVDMQVATEDPCSEKLVQFPPDEVSVEFGILLNEIVKELEKNKVENLHMLQTISAALTIQKNSKVHVFTDKQLEEIGACDSIRILLIYKLRHCYRWDDFTMLTKLMSKLEAKDCLNLLENFKVKVNSEMKLQQIYEHCKQKSVKFSAEYHKIVAIVDDKIFSKITKEEYDVLKHFVSEQCSVEDYVISPVTKITVSSLILEWYIPVTAVAHMIKIALNNKENFTKNCFVYLKISSTLIFDHRNIRVECAQLFLAAKKGDAVTIETLINDKYIDVNAIDDDDDDPPWKLSLQWDKRRALHYGAKNGHTAVVEGLIRAGADVNALGGLEKTPLHYGAENGHAAVVEGLVRAGANVNTVDSNSHTIRM